MFLDLTFCYWHGAIQHKEFSFTSLNLIYAVHMVVKYSLSNGKTLNKFFDRLVLSSRHT